MSLKTKLFAGFGLVIGIFIMAMTYNYVLLNSIESYKEVANKREGDKSRTLLLNYYVGVLYSNQADLIINEKADCIEDYKKNSEEFKQLITQVAEAVDTGEEKEWAKELLSLSNDYESIFNKVVALYNKRHSIPADEFKNEIRKLDDETDTIKNQIFKVSNNFNKSFGEEYKEASAALTNAINKSRAVSILTAVIAFGIGTVTAFVLSRAITGPVRALANAAGELSKGNLTVTIPEVSTKDEIYNLAGAFKTMVMNLREILQKIDSASRSVAATSEGLSSNAEEASKATQQVAQTIEQVAIGSSNQAQSVTGIVQVLNQMAMSIQQVAAGAGEQSKNVITTTDMVNAMVNKIDAMAGDMAVIKQISEQNGVVAEDGGQSVEKTVNGMLKVKEAVFDTAGRVHELA